MRFRMKGVKDWNVCFPACKKPNHNEGCNVCSFCKRPIGVNCDIKQMKKCRVKKTDYLCSLCVSRNLPQELNISGLAKPLTYNVELRSYFEESLSDVSLFSVKNIDSSTPSKRRKTNQ